MSPVAKLVALAVKHGAKYVSNPVEGLSDLLVPAGAAFVATNVAARALRGPLAKPVPRGYVPVAGLALAAGGVWVFTQTPWGRKYKDSATIGAALALALGAVKVIAPAQADYLTSPGEPLPDPLVPGPAGV